MRRRALKRDIAEPVIVEALRRAGYKVWLLHEPDDLLVRSHRWPANWFRFLSVKTPDAKGRIKKRTDQPEQDQFCETHGVPRVCTPEQALEALERV